MSDNPDVTYDPASHYDRITAAWGLLLGDELHYGVFDTGDEELAEATAALTQRMIAACRIEPGVSVLDVGCGTGAPACALAQDHGARVTGITTSVVGVAAADARAARAHLSDRVEFKVADGADNGLADASFDRVWVLESSHLIADRDRLVAECARVLRPGGRLALCDVMLRRPMPFLEVRRLRRELSLLRQVFGDAHLQPLERYGELVAEHGLVVEDLTDLTSATRPTFARWRDNALRYRHSVVAELGAPDWDRFVESCTVLEELWDDGTMGYGLVSASA
jgi:27-O-demethylrifamycin SV methyltransferase